MKVKAKKNLGQHFLYNDSISKNIVNLISSNANNVLEIGPGTGALTKFLINCNFNNFKVVEIDYESIKYLKKTFPVLQDKIIEKNFLHLHFNDFFHNESFNIIGNFPYNISSQILFKVYENKNKITQVVGMFQKEVAKRIVSNPKSKNYGILSVLIQAFYEVQYLFDVSPKNFTPPPKVDSAVIKLTRNNITHLECSESDFKKVIKTGFNQRRKMLKNSLKSLIKNHELSKSNPIFNKRPEELDVQQFVYLTKLLFSNQI